MATFTVEITPDSSNGTIAHAVGKFSGGSSSYKGQRRMDVTVSGVGTFSALSPETSGGENTFSLDITGLTPGTTYNWSASLYYKNTSGSWVIAGSQYDKSGSLTTKSGTPALPSGYTKLEYIESDNSAWLDTGITMEKTDTVTLEAVYSTAGTSDVRYFGANGYMQIAVTSGGYSINGTAKKALGTKDEIKCAYTPNTESLYVNNSLIDTNDWSSYNGVAVKIGLFKMGDASNGWFPGKAANGKLYRAVVTKNGATVRIFTPCKNANGIAGMWDEISSTFFQSASSFAFTAGPEVKPNLTAHKTLVGGTAYTVQGGKCRVNGTVYNILKGRTLIDGTVWDITFAPLFPQKGDLITMNLDGTDRQYRVLKIVDGTTVEVFRVQNLNEMIGYSGSAKYAGNNIDVALNQTYYNTLTTAAKNAIVAKDINQYSYASSNQIASGRASTFYYPANKWLRYHVGDRFVYALDLEDVEEYFDSKYTSNDLNTVFFQDFIGSSSDKRLWLRSMDSVHDDYAACIIYGTYAVITGMPYSTPYGVQPAFQIDLSKIDFTIN